jgi:hypothetical protein
LADEIALSCDAYERRDLKLYLEAPFAHLPLKYLTALHSALHERAAAVTWRMETRVDTIRPCDAECLYAGGCRVVDLGLESASPQILLSMGKTSNTQTYLDRAAATIRALSEHGIFPKINVLFYPGETWASLSDTYDFLNNNRPFIGAISAGPCFLYPGVRDRQDLCRRLDAAGGSLIEDDPIWNERRLIPMNLSADISFSVACDLALSWEREFQTAERYFYQRQYGYFAPGATMEQFLAEVSAAGEHLFPF